MERIYLDNAATTPIDPRVTEVMSEVMKKNYGNPSSIHSLGRESRSLIEKSRKKIATLLGVTPGEIFFTSGGTEADNTALSCPVYDQGVNHIITTRIEHHAVLHTVERLREIKDVKVTYIGVDSKGNPDLSELEKALKENEDKKTIVSLMHANNEIGTIADLTAIGNICQKYGALFHSDTVQTLGHYKIFPGESNINFLTASAHKFNGPKGIGFLYVDHNITIKPFIQGGSQERNMRAGTENIYGIAGLAKALEIAYEEMEAEEKRIFGLKEHMMNRLKEEIPGVEFSGETSKDKGLYTVLNVSFPPGNKNEMLLFNLDIEGICCSGGSACSSGSNKGSHVVSEIAPDTDRTNLRFSFGRFNKQEDVDATVEKLKKIL